MTVPVQEDIHNAPAVQSRPRFRMTIATALTLGFGLLVFVLPMLSYSFDFFSHVVPFKFENFVLVHLGHTLIPYVCVGCG